MRPAAIVVSVLVLAAEWKLPPDPSDLVANLCQRVPERPAGAVGGAAFGRTILNLKGAPREQALLHELERGNLPPFLKELKPVRLSSCDRNGILHQATIFVMPDYLAVGSDADFLRVPLGLETAKNVARQFGFSLPTRKMVDAIYQQSSLRLAPQPMKPGPQMSSTAYYLEHQRMIEAERAGRAPGELVSGHKKDLILTKRLVTRRGRVAIYGWHRRGGRPIQPLSTVHGARYADYSHGVRLVSTTVMLDGRARSLFEVLRDPDLAGVLSYEGTIRDAARIMGYPANEPAAGTRRGDGARR